MADLGAQLSQLSPEQRQAIMIKAQQEANQSVMQEMMKEMITTCFDKCAGTSVRDPSILCSYQDYGGDKAILCCRYPLVGNVSHTSSSSPVVVAGLGVVRLKLIHTVAEPHCVWSHLDGMRRRVLQFKMTSYSILTHTSLFLFHAIIVLYHP
jgi:hypothetical protein